METTFFVKCPFCVQKMSKINLACCFKGQYTCSFASFQNFTCKFKHRTGPTEPISGVFHSSDHQMATLTRVKKEPVPDAKVCILRMSPVLFERCMQLACIPINADKVG